MSSSCFSPKTKLLIGRTTARSANQKPGFWWETTWNHFLTGISEKTAFRVKIEKHQQKTGISSLTKKMALEAFKYKRGELLVLDQLKLPHCHEYIQVKTTDDGWLVINKMQVKIHSLVEKIHF